MKIFVLISMVLLLSTSLGSTLGKRKASKYFPNPENKERRIDDRISSDILFTDQKQENARKDSEDIAMIDNIGGNENSFAESTRVTYKNSGNPGNYLV
jgi:hypothetical protein